MKLIHKDERHPHVTISFSNLGNAYKSKGQYDQAIYFYVKSLEIFKFFEDKLQSAFADSLTNLRAVYHLKGHYDLATKYYKESFEVKKLIHGDEPHPDVIASLNNLGKVCCDKRQFEEAILFYEQSFNIIKNNRLIFADNYDLHLASSLEKLGVVYRAKGRDYNQAIKCSSQAWQISEFWKSPQTDAIKKSLINTIASFTKNYSLNPQQDEEKFFVLLHRN